MLKDKEVIKIKEMYPKGTRIKLEHMDDPLHPILDGMLGTVDHVDDAGQIHMKWDNGRALAIVPEVDSFSIVDEDISKDMIRVLIIEAENHPRIENIHNDLKTMQDIVGGQIEEIGFGEDAVLICNEEGKLMNLKANRSVGNDIIAGTFFIAGDDGGEELISLTDEQIKEITDRFYEIEEHTQEEMMSKIGFKIYGF
ncbi:DUF3846 domain-containing protein [Thomasclavelia cocleata]|uniref:DUF3846 domain-containing protein n=1 Tax=Thomasclavelia cocleata TaxID=69824 RepID=UPI0025708695|nr:DUF4314 domain-containing protein [Thomasclavelia cocleata]